MRRRVIVPAVVTICLAALSIVVMTLTAGGSASAAAAGSQQTFLTFYGWWDNTPPGGNISFPGLHQTAGGTGTFSDPITFASDRAEIAPGSKIFVPRVGKYFIMEDDCEECDADWSGMGPDGGPNLAHFDLWLGGQGGNPIKAIECEDALTNFNDDGSPSMEPVIVNPPSNEPVAPQPIFDTSTGACFGGATPTTTVGQYKNTGTGLCLDDPTNSATNGFRVGAAACGGAAEQQFTFDGTFLSIHNLCADSGGGAILFKTCTGGPTQQWSANTNGTISDIQTGQKCFRVAGTTVTAGSCSGSAAQWTFPSTTVPTSTTTPPPTTTTTPPAGGRSYEGEAGALGGTANVTSCAACSGGHKVSGLGTSGQGTVTVSGVSESAAGTYTMTVSYLAVGKAKPATITVDGATQTVTFPETSPSSFSVVGTFSVTVHLTAGSNNTITFAGMTGSGLGAPDLDRIVV